MANIYGKSFVEGMLAEKMASLKGALDVLALPKSITKMDRGANVVAMYSIWREELDELRALLDGYHDRALSKRHREARKFSLELLSWLEEVDLVEQGATDAGSHVEFVRRAVEFLNDFHSAMTGSDDEVN